MVAEYMILVGDLTADYARKNNIPVPYRIQLRSEIDEKPIHKKEKSDGIKSWIQKLIFQLDFLSQLSSVRLSVESGPHGGLGVSSYVQASSPIRRYMDLLVHYQIKAYIRGEKLPFNKDEILIKIFEIEEKQLDLNKLMQTSQRYWILRYLERQDPTRKYLGLVLSIQKILKQGSQSLVLLLDIGYKLSMALKKLPLKGDIIQLQIASIDGFNNTIAWEQVE